MQFEALLQVQHHNWLGWVSWDLVNVKSPVWITYNRLHHRAVEQTQLSALNQEKLTLKFHQSIINVPVFNIGLATAMSTDCI